MTNDTNSDFVNQLLFSCPETGEELRPVCPPQTNDQGDLVIHVRNQSGSQKWKHTIHTEEY